MDTSFSEKIRNLRESKKLTQEQFAQQLFVSRSTVVKWEQNRKFPDAETLQRISEIFDVSLDELISEKEIEAIKVPISKKVSLSKRVIILLAGMLSIVSIVGVTLGSIYHPRNISSYIKDDISFCERIEVQNQIDGTIYTFDGDTQKELISRILKVSVVPKHLFIQKVTSSFNVLIYFEENTYIINQFFLHAGTKVFYYEPVDYIMHQIICEYVGEIA